MTSSTPGSSRRPNDRAGYAPAWGGDCAADGTDHLAPGDNATCTITNNDVPADADAGQDGRQRQRRHTDGQRTSRCSSAARQRER